MLRARHVGHLAALIAAACLSTFAEATTQRTFVASHGVDNPTCSLTSPCRAFAAAIAATTAGGEVIVLDAAGYGPVTINQSVSIVAPPGVYAGISVASGAGVTVAASSITDTVLLKGLTITGVGGATGISVTSAGTLRIVDCTVSGMSQDGISLSGSARPSSVLISNTTVANNTMHGILATVGTGFTFKLTLDHVTVSHNGIGASGYGVRLVGISSTNFFTTIHSSLIADNATGLQTEGTMPIVTTLVTESNIVNNNASLSSGTSTTIVLEKTSVRTINGGITNNGAIFSYGDNAISDQVFGNAITAVPLK